MSGISDPNKVYEIAYRTKINYYRGIMWNEELPEEERSRAKVEIEFIYNEMKRKNYTRESFYHITALLNSLVGLLVLPEQFVFDNISNNENDLSIILPHLEKCAKRNDFVNTYNGEKKKSPKKLIQHIKNSLSHDRVMIIPESKKDGDITSIDSIIFQDAKLTRKVKRNGYIEYKNVDEILESYHGDIKKFKWDSNDSNLVFSKFSITIPANRFEKIVMEIADYLLSL